MRRIGLIVVGAFMALFASAQSTQFGLKGGVNLANIKDQNAPNGTDTRTGFHVGALAHIHLNNQFAVQPEVVYSSEGAKYNVPGWTGTDKIDYINIPVNLQYMVHNLRLQTGPQLGVLTKAKLEHLDESQREINNINNVNFSWTAGASYLFPGGVGLDARYNHGISNMYEHASIDAKSRVWQLGLFYQFPH